MKQICIVGPIDKRLLVYPLIKVADILGTVLVVTDDSNIRRFAENYEKEFSWGKSEFIVVNDINKEVIEELKLKLNNYDCVIFMTTNTIIEDVDILVYCHGRIKNVLTENNLEELEGKEYKEVIITESKPLKNEIIIKVSKQTMGYVWKCEENKAFMPCVVAELANVSSTVFSDILGVKKEEFKKIMTRQVG